MSLIDMRIDVDYCFPDQIDVYDRRSNSVPFVLFDEWNPGRSSNAYTKLPDEPLRLSVLKLDATSFDIAVMKSATVAELKEAVEHAFSFVPRKGPGKISWYCVLLECVAMFLRVEILKTEWILPTLVHRAEWILPTLVQ